MGDDQPDLTGDDSPPLDLGRETYGYLVLSAGVAAGVVVLFYFPRSVPYWRLARLPAALVVAVLTHYAYQYVTTTWYDRFEDARSTR